MNEDRPSQPTHHKTWIERLGQVFGGHEPRDRQDLIAFIRASQERGVLDADALAMIEGVLHVSELQARDIMIPRAQVTVLTRESDPKALLPTIVETGYSRFPVVGENRDDVVGILLAKDVLKAMYTSPDRFDIREYLRPPLFIPESKRLDALLKQFKESRHHMAVVVDEYGGMAGLVTIEDVIEQIVGEIDDEHDFDEDTNILDHEHGHSIVKALTPIEEFNEHFLTNLSDEEFDTIGGLVAHRLGHVPRRGEAVEIDGQRLQVIRADNRRIHLLMVSRAQTESSPAAASH